VPATAKAAEPIVPFGAAPRTGEPIAPFTTASQPAAQAPFAKAPSDSAPAPFAKAPADLPEDQTAEHASTTQHAAPSSVASHASPTSVASHASPASVAAAAGLPQAKPTAALPAATPIVDAPMAPVASKPVVAMKLPARSPRASQRIRAAELAAAPPAAATVAIAPQNLPMPEAATLPPAAVAQEPAPGWVVVSLPARPRPAAVAKAPEPAPVMARITLPSRPRAPQLASAPHLASTLAKPASASYRVKAGDTLSDIALRELGSSTLWHVVYEANRDQLTNPRWLEVGLTLKIPRGNDAGGQVYVVKQGDSLSKIARLMLGDMKKWRDLYAANKQQIRDPWFIYPGQRLVLPGTQNLACLPVDQRWATLKATVYPPA
jgi:nucleoid-associated protein YgaU